MLISGKDARCLEMTVILLSVAFIEQCLDAAKGEPRRAVKLPNPIRGMVVEGFKNQNDIMRIRIRHSLILLGYYPSHPLPPLIINGFIQAYNENKADEFKLWKLHSIIPKDFSYIGTVVDIAIQSNQIFSINSHPWRDFIAAISSDVSTMWRDGFLSAFYRFNGFGSPREEEFIATMTAIIEIYKQEKSRWIDSYDGTTSNVFFLDALYMRFFESFSHPRKLQKLALKYSDRMTRFHEVDRLVEIEFSKDLSIEVSTNNYRPDLLKLVFGGYPQILHHNPGVLYELSVWKVIARDLIDISDISVLDIIDQSCEMVSRIMQKPYIAEEEFSSLVECVETIIQEIVGSLFEDRPPYSDTFTYMLETLSLFV